MTIDAVNRSVKANATISMVVGEWSLVLRQTIKQRMAFPTRAVKSMVIRTVDSIATVTLRLASSCSCNIASTSTLASPGSMLFMIEVGRTPEDSNGLVI